MCVHSESTLFYKIDLTVIQRCLIHNYSCTPIVHLRSGCLGGYLSYSYHFAWFTIRRWSLRSIVSVRKRSSRTWLNSSVLTLVSCDSTHEAPASYCEPGFRLV